MCSRDSPSILETNLVENIKKERTEPEPLLPSTRILRADIISSNYLRTSNSALRGNQAEHSTLQAEFYIDGASYPFTQPKPNDGQFRLTK